MRRKNNSDIREWGPHFLVNEWVIKIPVQLTLRNCISLKLNGKIYLYFLGLVKLIRHRLIVLSLILTYNIDMLL